MIIRLHRWQPKSNRYRTQIFNSTDERASLFTDILARNAVQQNSDPSVKQIICRTQQIDRILIDAQNEGTVDIWMTPFIERNYPTERKPFGNKIKETIKTLGGGTKATETIYGSFCAAKNCSLPRFINSPYCEGHSY